MLDDTDRRLLTALQRDAQAPMQVLADTLGLSASQIGRRKQRLEAQGFITRYAAHLSPKQVGLTVQAFVQVQMETHGAPQARAFAQLIDTRAEVISAWTLTGEADYLLRVWTRDLADLNRLIHDVLLAHPTVARVQSQIVMDQMKADGPLPI